MMKNNLKIAFRNLTRNKLVSSINLFGLTIGIGCSLLLLMYVKYEHSFDDFMSDGDRIYRLIQQEKGQNARKIGLSGNETFADLAENYALVDQALKVRDMSYPMAPNGDFDKKVDVDFLYATSNFFSFFDFPLLHGDAESVLSDPSSIVISEETALRLFGKTDAIGESLTIDASLYYTFQKELIVRGVSKKVTNSHIQFEAIVPWEMKGPQGRVIADMFFSRSLYTYVKVVEGGQVIDIANEQNRKLLEKTPDADTEYFFQPLSDIYLGSNDILFLSFITGNSQTVNTLMYVAIVILLIAGINYVNLQTAKASKRALEVGVKKAIGASRKELMGQFLTESFLITLIASIFAVLVIDLSLPAFNNLTGKSFDIQLLIENGLFFYLPLILIVTALLSGFYPSLVLSGFQPSKVLKSANANTPGKKGMRSALLLVQFGVSICLMAVTYLIYQQSNFISQKELGFNKDQVINFGVTGKGIGPSVESFRKELDQYPNIAATSLSTDVLGTGYTNNSGTVYSKNNLDINSSATIFGVDHSFVTTYEMVLSEGREFDQEAASDSNAVIVNQAFVNALGLEDPLNSNVTLYQPNGPNYRIIGVVNDFHFQKLHEKINPVVLRIAEHNLWQLSVRLEPESMAESISFIEQKWNEFETETAFSYSFVDQKFARFYAEDNRMFKAVSFFSIVSVILTIMGLFAMTVFSIEQKMKEIGIRKVLGATIGNVFTLVFKDFILILGLSIVIAAPLVYLLGNTWLARFAYRIDMTPLPMVLASLMALLVISGIVSGLATKAAKTNPVNTLRSE